MTMILLFVDEECEIEIKMYLNRSMQVALIEVDIVEADSSNYCHSRVSDSNRPMVILVVVV